MAPFFSTARTAGTGLSCAGPAAAVWTAFCAAAGRASAPARAAAASIAREDEGRIG
ncbi:MAG: hypothetical protein AVDCRST_MAG89-5037 [uncultured Gemmatimonadetes bacterium]|uniref:Uncharacterized protein n=1 Tax=uncultured Gemmatimonadota bacterium TaxID=203437 RepID=A0A6J4N8Z3_9BACT|nr:MAG: hypothetical protein AVDCRST_MAG89-5037 [uncultured Gemmatimonadota bacterium]